MIEIYKKFQASDGVTTDSRKVGKNQLFFALKGDNFDGNKFAEQAVADGAICAVVDKESEIGRRIISEKGVSDRDKYIVVDNTLAALQDLARWNRSQYNIPVIAITGTNGKTTTKELVSSVLAAKYHVVCTQGNLNNHIGVPMTLLNINASTEIAVVEMGASAPKEIEALVNIALPTYGLITNVGKAHLLGFGSFEGVMRTKGELYDYLQRCADIAFYNIDNQHLRTMVSQRPDLRVSPYGLNYSGAEIMTVDEEHPFLRISMPEKGVIETNLIGGYNADNVMAAIAVGDFFKVPFNKIVDVIAHYHPTNNRSELKRSYNNLLVIDAYNANPTSMMASLKNFEATLFPHKVLILGDMRELGEDSFNEHTIVMEYASSMRVEKVIYVGAEFGLHQDKGKPTIVHEGKEVRFFASVVDLVSYLQTSPLINKTILIKGSNGIKLQSIVGML